MAGGVHRKGPGRGWVFRWREFDQATNKVVKRTSEEYGTRALALTASTQERSQTKQLRAAPSQIGAMMLTLRAALALHPSHRKAAEEDQRKAERYLDVFVEFAGITLARHLTLAKVQDYIDHLRDDGKAWDTRRHRLLPVRRAARMAATVGIPDPLAGLRLDERPRGEPEVDAWTLAEIVQGLATIDDPRARRAIALGGLLGLRPSEIARARYCDLRHNDGHRRLAIGLRAPGESQGRTAKNQPSRRLLPIPIEVWPFIIPGGPEPESSAAPLVPSLSPRSRGSALTQTSITQWLGPILAKHLPRGLEMRHLRKSFLTWATTARAEYWPLEEWVGHQTPQVVGVTARHYLADQYDHQAQRLQPLADLLGATVGDTLGDTPTRVPQRGTINLAEPVREQRKLT